MGPRAPEIGETKPKARLCGASPGDPLWPLLCAMCRPVAHPDSCGSGPKEGAAEEDDTPFQGRLDRCGRVWPMLAYLLGANPKDVAPVARCAQGVLNCEPEFGTAFGAFPSPECEGRGAPACGIAKETQMEVRDCRLLAA